MITPRISFWPLRGWFGDTKGEMTFTAIQQSPDFLLFLARFHPLLVHLPIGFLVILVVLESLGRTQRFRGANASAPYILALLAPAAIITAITGWILSRSGEYDGRILQAHRWLGVSIALLCMLMAVLHRVQWRRAYAGCLYLAAAVLLLASHFGGSLTHGSDYLVRYAPPLIRAVLGGQPPGTSTALRNVNPDGFEAAVRPILEARCGACHNAQKHKGGLRTDTIERLMRGGENGPVVLRGDARNSPLIKRLQLPLEDDDHMPPEGKPQPSPREIEVLRRWIDAGAPGPGMSNANFTAALEALPSPPGASLRR